MQPSIYCPLCQNTQVLTRNWGRKTIALLGAAAGAAGSFAAAICGGQKGTTVGLVAGPAGSAFGGLAGAILGSLASSAIGCEMGSSVGQVFDNHVFDNYKCNSCGHTFRLE